MPCQQGNMKISKKIINIMLSIKISNQSVIRDDKTINLLVRNHQSLINSERLFQTIGISSPVVVVDVVDGVVNSSITTSSCSPFFFDNFDRTRVAMSVSQRG